MLMQAFDEAFVSGFREVIWISVGMALLSALSAQIIQSKKHIAPGRYRRQENTDRYHRPIDSSQRFWLNDQQVLGLNHSTPTAVQLGCGDGDRRMIVVCNSHRVIQKVRGK